MNKALHLLVFTFYIFTGSANIRGQSIDPDQDYGSIQVRKMLLDLPDMAEYTTVEGKRVRVTEEDAIWKWAATQYERRIVGARIQWGGQEVDKPMTYQAEHVMPLNGAAARINIRPSFQDETGTLRKQTFEELWSDCDFELMNLENDVTFQDFNTRAYSGEMSKNTYVRLNTELEYKALMKRLNFAREIWIPWADEHKYKYDPKVWGTTTIPENYDEWIKQYTQAVHNPYTFWDDYYTNSIYPYLEKAGLKPPGG
jgi:hypothetical protein